MMKSETIQTAGMPLLKAEKVVIMIHGRGASPEDILSLSQNLELTEYALFAPAASNYTWYPYSFLAPQERNEPFLSASLHTLNDLVKEIQLQGISSKNLYFLGFSQGACLTLEYAARNAQPFGGIVAFTGGLIGDTIEMGNYHGNFHHTPVFISTGNPDPHVPVSRVEETAGILKKMHASVHVKIYDNRPHTVTEDEIKKAKELIFR